LTAPIQIVQLTDEINAAVTQNVTLAVTGPATGDLTSISVANPAVLSVTPGGLSMAAVQQVINAHMPQDGYDVPEAERRFTAILAKLNADAHAVLSASEIQDALRGLVIRTSVRPLNTTQSVA